MCNLTKKTDLKTVTVYKSVVKIYGDYYSIFAGCKIERGTVKPQPRENPQPLFHGRNFFERYDHLFNENLVGKSSGFKSKEDARIVARGETVLKIELGGEIWIGDATNISGDIPVDHIIYAGSEIINFKEI